MLGVGIHIHFRPDTTVELDTLRGPDKPRIMVSDYHDASVTIYPGIDGLRRLHEAIGSYLAEHDAPATPPIPAEAATDDAESLPAGWRANDCGYEHICGDWVNTNHPNTPAMAYVAGGDRFGRFATPLQAMQALDANRRDLDDDTGEFDAVDITSSPTPPGIASSYGQGFGVEISEDEIRAGRINTSRQVS